MTDDQSEQGGGGGASERESVKSVDGEPPKDGIRSDAQTLRRSDDRRTAGKCWKCGERFVYVKKPQKGRKTCDRCRRATVMEARKRFKRMARLEADEPVGQSVDGFCGLALLTQDEVAAHEGLTKQRVQQIERTALWKLRNNPGAQQLWGEYLEAFEASARLGLKMRTVNGADELLSACERQIECWLTQHAPLLAECPEEAEEFLAVVGELQAVLRRLKAEG